MKRKTILLLLFIVFSIMILGTVVLATVNNNENQDKILTEEKISSVSETYKEIDLNMKKVKALNNQLDKANTYLEDINAETEFFTNENANIKMFINALESRQEIVISNEKSILRINSETGELLSYTNNKNDFTTNTLTDIEIKERAISIFNNLNNIDKNNYELLYIEKFDDEIWRVGFAKEYDGIINEGESIKFSFCPETKELVTLSINKIIFDNNEVILSKDDARNIAQIYLDRSVAGNMDIDIDIVRPNYFYAKSSNDDSIYVNIEKTRKAYVCTFNNESKSKVYIDCTTGEVIGGDIIVGGAY